MPVTGKRFSLVRRNRLMTLLVLMAALLCAPLTSQAQEAASLEVVVVGIEGPAAQNIISSVGSNWSTVRGLGSQRSQRRLLRRVEADAVTALRPLGYYHATVTGKLIALEDERWRLQLTVEPGPAVEISELDLRVSGAGASEPLFQDWVSQWPLQPGAVLNQGTWETEKFEMLNRANEYGFIEARFLEQRIALDLEQNRAALTLILDTGEQARFGTIIFLQDFVNDAVLQSVPRFKSGGAYDHWQIDRFRTDLWQLGFFDTIDVREIRVPNTAPPVIDLEVKLTPTHRYTHQGTIGYGTDTEIRTQYRLQRHQLSPRGDSYTAGLAWQQRNSESLLYGEYRLPRRTDGRQYWLLNPIFTDRDQVFEVDIQGQTETIPLASGRVSDFYLRSGKVKLRFRDRVAEPIIETLFIDYLYERNNITDVFFQTFDDGGQVTDTIIGGDTAQYLSPGIEYDLPQFSGQGFDITGHRDRAWLFTSNEAWGSAVDFTQLYISSRWIIPVGNDWRLLLRGELGYTDAPVNDFEVVTDDETLLVSLTELPFRYRFFAGGSFSVRGYDFESLSNNGVGSNNVVTASAEIERRIWNDWSVAAFVDTGNAFNDWGDAALFTGIGVGVRWYAAGFPIRLDVAQAQDLEGKPWQIHLTIGSTLF